MAANYHLVHYRRFNAAKASRTLEELCRTALARKDAAGKSLWLRPNDRIMTETPVAGKAVPRQFLMNRVADLSSAMFGEVCLANEKDLQALLRMEPRTQALSDVSDTAFFDLSESEAPTGARFIRGIGYWLCIGNHFFFITLQSLSAGNLIDYVRWLVSEAAITANISFDKDSFQMELDESVVGKDSIGKVKALRVRGNSPLGIRVPIVEPGPTKKRAYSRKVRSEHTTHSAARRIIDAVLGPDKADRLMSTLGPDEYVTAEAEIRVRGTKTEETLNNVKQIVSAIADETDAQIEVEGSEGKIKDGDAILRMRMPFAIPNEGGTLLDFDNVSDQIQKVYLRFLDDGKIKA